MCYTSHKRRGCLRVSQKKRTLVHLWDARPKRRLYDRGGVLEGERGGGGAIVFSPREVRGREEERVITHTNVI